MSTISFIFTGFLPAMARSTVGCFVDVLAKGFDESQNRPIRLSHFLPYTKFEDIVSQPDPNNEAETNEAVAVDLSNGDVYWADDPNVTRLKCLALATATPIVHAISTLLNLVNRIAKLVLLAHFWYPSLDKEYCFSKRAWTFGKDLLRVAFAPLTYIGLELSALYGLILPKNGQKLYATLERCAFGDGLLAPCFQPNPTQHLGGGIPGKKNEW